MNLLREKLKKHKIIIGMVHLLPLPGSPNYKGNLEAVYEAGLKDLRALINKIAFASMVARLRKETKLPVGINYQFNDVETEWAVAYSCDVDFIRCEVFAENRVGPNGMFIAAGPELMRIKAHYNKDIMILADANVKHTFALSFRIDTAKAASKREENDACIGYPKREQTRSTV